MTEIEDVIESFDKNIEFLKNPHRLKNKDIKGLLLDIIGIMKDMWEKFNNVFKMMDEVKEIEEATKKGEKFEEMDSENKDLKRLYL